MKQVTIPQYVDELPQIWFWELDEAFFLFMGVFIGLLVGWMFTGIVIGVIVAGLFGKFKQGQNRGLLIHIGYWLGIIPLKGMWCSISFEREWSH
jgi:conjugal transfer pilus assembly protein TraL